MSLRGKSVGIWWYILSLFGPAIIGFHSGQATGFPDLVVRVGDTTGLAGTGGMTAPIRMYNYLDSVAGFDFRVTSDHPDVVSLSQQVDTSGALTAGWELLGTEAVGGDDTLRIVGMANMPYPREIQPGIGYPQLEPTPLVRLGINVAVTEEISEPLDITLSFVFDDPTHFIFSDEQGRAIGVNTDTIVDTLWLNCLQWADPEHQECTLWDTVGGPPADTFLVDSVRVGWLDTSRVYVFDGVLRVNPGVCGDVAGQDGKVTLSDISYLIGYVFLDGPPPSSIWAANVNGSDDMKITISDISRLIDHVYVSKGALDCR